MVLVSCQAPDFTAPAVLGTGEIVNNFNLQSYIQNKLAVIFFWPMDFTFVCPSEIISFDKRYTEFKKRDVEIIGISIDSEFAHLSWRNMLINKGGIGSIQYPMISDKKREIIKAYGIEHPTLGIALRASFLVDKNGIIRHQIVNDLPLGRNINEMIRTIDALKFHEEYGELCPAQWENGQEGIKDNLESIAKYLSNNLHKL